MARPKLTVEAVEQSTYVITASFTDETGAAVTPNVGLIWTLTDRNGVVINGRSAVSITPGESVKIVLSGADLDFSGADALRLLTVEGTYDSSLGLGLPLKEEAEFVVRGLAAV